MPAAIVLGIAEIGRPAAWPGARWVGDPLPRIVVVFYVVFAQLAIQRVRFRLEKTRQERMLASVRGADPRGASSG